MSVDQMPTGQELNMLIAELMGWERATDKTWRDGDTCYCVGKWPTWESESVVYFKPSVDEDHAGLVVDRLVAQGYAVTVYTGPYRDQGVKARCCILRAGDLATSDGVDAIADKRPLAICRAALKARERWGGVLTVEKMKAARAHMMGDEGLGR